MTQKIDSVSALLRMHNIYVSNLKDYAVDYPFSPAGHYTLKCMYAGLDRCKSISQTNSSYGAFGHNLEGMWRTPGKEGYNVWMPGCCWNCEKPRHLCICNLGTGLYDINRVGRYKTKRVKRMKETPDVVIGDPPRETPPLSRHQIVIDDKYIFAGLLVTVLHTYHDPYETEGKALVDSPVLRSIQIVNVSELEYAPPQAASDLVEVLKTEIDMPSHKRSTLSCILWCLYRQDIPQVRGVVCNILNVLHAVQITKANVAAQWVVQQMDKLNKAK